MKKYIDSGILEVFVMGAATDEEVRELMYMKAKHPEVEEALKQLETDMEKLAGEMAIAPPPHMWEKIEDEIDGLIHQGNPAQPIKFRTSDDGRNKHKKTPPEDQFIPIESESNHMRLHKSWRWVFAAVFVLGKIFLGFAIYFYLENRQTRQQLQELKTEIRELKKR
ncbi:hypothetical protein ACRQ5D_01425 [Mucilaginibacter sp. P25]|uniref:Anti-sigma factor n=1 Tax=Mucilaginibacter gossypii TaxID=551996 RepID=A0A1G7WN03_9SPHI|nr:hypothetical protein [Mucilaginibacter gossypii]SDG73322.1 hypothetical protein SAMN05192573_104487 [Mucilaginibacter gossypii]